MAIELDEQHHGEQSADVANAVTHFAHTVREAPLHIVMGLALALGRAAFRFGFGIDTVLAWARRGHRLAVEADAARRAGLN